MQCEICGKESNLYRCLIEKIEMDVCENCSRFGKNFGESSLSKSKLNKKSISTFVIVTKDYSKIIKENREKRTLKQEEIASKLNIKESLIHKIENGNIELSIELAKKFEKFFNIKLLEEYKEEVNLGKIESKEMTIGDLLKEKIK